MAPAHSVKKTSRGRLLCKAKAKATERTARIYIQTGNVAASGTQL